MFSSRLIERTGLGQGQDSRAELRETEPGAHVVIARRLAVKLTCVLPVPDQSGQVMRRIFQRRVALFVAVALAAAGTNAGQQPRSKSKRSPDVQNTATIEGVVIYKPDSERPWRYARHYVQDRNQGRLAETVVALVAPDWQEPGPPRRQTTSVIDQENFTFIPETVAIRAGDRVKFKNSDQAVHNVNSFASGNEFNVNMPAGGEHVETFSSAGGIGDPVTIGCIYHSAMRAWVYVFAHPYYQVTKSDGRFRFNDVPSGKYMLEMIHPAGKLHWNKPLQIKAGEQLTFDVTVSPDNKVKSIRLRRSKGRKKTPHDREKTHD